MSFVGLKYSEYFSENPDIITVLVPNAHDSQDNPLPIPIKNSHSSKSRILSCNGISPDLFVIPDLRFVQDFGAQTVAQPEFRDIFCLVDQIIYPLRFSFVSPIFGGVPFLFLVQFLKQLVLICQFSWFQPGDRLYEMIYCAALLSSSVVLRGQSLEDPRRNLYAECGVPYFRLVSEAQRAAYFGWRVASVCCFSNDEPNYLRVLFRLPVRSLVRDYQRAQIRVEIDDGEEYYEYDLVGDDGRRVSVGPEVEERSYTADEQRRFLLELQELGYSSRLPSQQLVDEISIYSRRRFEGYLAHSALDESRLGIPLASHILEYYSSYSTDGR
jgi:hypothetical protein